jgi:hypothetical protein
VKEFGAAMAVDGRKFAFASGGESMFAGGLDVAGCLEHTFLKIGWVDCGAPDGLVDGAQFGEGELRVAKAKGRWGFLNELGHFLDCVTEDASMVKGEAVVTTVNLVEDADTVACVTDRLLGITQQPETPAEWPAGPVEVAPGVHAADLAGATRVPKDWAVVSLCRTGTSFVHHPVRRQIFLIDQPGDHNPALREAVTDAVEAIEAFIAEGRKVVVHCHGGRSRTGLVLKAWKIRTDGLNEREAHTWLAERWERYQDYNQAFLDLLRNGWPTEVG